ncbi:MAG: hypothetical protein JWS10_4200 [Cypionkella sp.]|nr:hypothetical protein [Cypionkella sp.]
MRTYWQNFYFLSNINTLRILVFGRLKAFQFFRFAHPMLCMSYFIVTGPAIFYNALIIKEKTANFFTWVTLNPR